MNILDKVTRKKIISIFLLITCFNITGLCGYDSVQESLNQNTKILIKVDTLNLKSFPTEKKSKSWYENSAMPWIMALLVSILTIIVNILIAKNNLKTSKINLDRQLQMTKELTLRQINNAKEIAFTEFKATINSKNRQDWINELRSCISEFLTQCAMINIEMANNSDNLEKIKPYFEVIVKNKSRIAMLINLEKEEQKAILKPINDMMSVSFSPENDWDVEKYKIYEDELLNATRNLLQLQWVKIKNLT